MLRLIFFLILFIAAIYFLMWLKGRFNRLAPDAKKKLLFFGLSNVFNFFRNRWFWILTIAWKILKRFIGR